jgi:hypothetical protein
VHFETYGEMDAEAGKPMAADTIFRADHFGRHAPPLGDLLLLPTRADRTFLWPSPTNELF